jgi:hypothetical protein
MTEHFQRARRDRFENVAHEFFFRFFGSREERRRGRLRLSQTAPHTSCRPIQQAIFALRERPVSSLLAALLASILLHD